MLTADELTGMRDDLETTLVDECVIERFTSVSDGLGGSEKTWAAVGTVLCRVSPAVRGAADVPQGDRSSNQTEWIITLPFGTDVTEQDRLTALGVSYNPFQVKAPRTWELSRRVRCQVIT